MIIILTGASGVGKTTILEFLEDKCANSSFTLHKFDSIGVPRLDAMIREFGSGSNWQRKATFDWIEKLVSQHQNTKQTPFLEGQMNIDFIRAAFEEQKFVDYKVILIDCEVKEMKRRLIEERKQPELATPDMENWLRFLRQQAETSGLSIIRTENKTVMECAQDVLNLIN